MTQVQGKILAFDTTAAHCAAAFVEGDRLLTRYEPMQRGQAERLMPMLEELLAEAGAGWSDLDGLAVGIGPGNFTGIRIAVAAARGLALALRIPCIGVSGFELLARPADQGPVLLTLPAPRGQIYGQIFDKDAPQGAPQLWLPEEGLPEAFAAVPLIRGAGQMAHEAVVLENPAEHLAHRARLRFAQGRIGPKPAPLYVRPPDAAPPSDPAPVILDV